MIFYFTATGNSLLAAQKLAKELQEPNLVDISEAMQKNQYQYTLQAQEKIIFVCPTYYYGLPLIIPAFLSKLEIKQNSHPLYVLMTCGGDIGAADKKFKELLTEHNLQLTALYTADFTDCYILYYDLPSLEEQATKTAKGVKDIDYAIEQIKANSQQGYTSSIKGTIYSTTVYPFYLYGRKTAKFYAEDTCVACGYCANICPLEVIKIENQKPQWTKDNCMHCLACIHRCPKQAIQYGSSTKKRGRYVNPLVKDQLTIEV